MKKAIDLYSGIGGWTLGLKMAGIEVLSSFEWWEDANRTHNMNFNKRLAEVNIRELDVSTLPKPGTIDFVVGSPPCTQFSYSNRGGNGDISDGMKDIYKFLEVVEYLQPQYWAMENVPRVSKIIEKEILKGGQLNRFSSLFTVNQVVDISEYGLPQRRKRMIAGNFPLHLFEAYKETTNRLSLGDVISSLKKEPIIDPIYGYTLNQDELTDHEKEPALSKEEERINRDNKTHHPIYNKMSFPDKLDKPSRTVTALCTRVSRESIVIKENNSFRRLTIRERGLVQSFPITFQYYGKTYGSKMKMIGNAIPPLITYYLAQSFLNTPKNKVKSPKESKYTHSIPQPLPDKVKINVVGKQFTANRKFKAAVPNLRFGSGVRFELENIFIESELDRWRINFFYGSSKKIERLNLKHDLVEYILDTITNQNRHAIYKKLEILRENLSESSSQSIQEAWIHKSKHKGPYDIIDQIGELALNIINVIKLEPKGIIQQLLLDILKENNSLDSSKKLLSYSNEIISGIIVGSWFNEIFANEYELIN